MSELKKLNQQESDSLDKGQLNKIMPSHGNKLGGVGLDDNQPSPTAPFKTRPGDLVMQPRHNQAISSEIRICQVMAVQSTELPY